MLMSIGTMANCQTESTFFPDSYKKQFSSGTNEYLYKYVEQSFYEMKFSSIWLAPSEPPSFRFTWLRSFDEPISIFLTKNGSKFSLKTSIFEINDNGHIGKLLKENSKSLKKVEWNRFERLLIEAQFFELAPMLDPQFKDKWVEITTDGAYWIFESNYKHRYHMVFRHSPENTPFHRLCLYLIRLSGLKLKKTEIY